MPVRSHSNKPFSPPDVEVPVLGHDIPPCYLIEKWLLMMRDEQQHISENRIWSRTAIVPTRPFPLLLMTIAVSGDESISSLKLPSLPLRIIPSRISGFLETLGSSGVSLDIMGICRVLLLSL